MDRKHKIDCHSMSYLLDEVMLTRNREQEELG